MEEEEPFWANERTYMVPFKTGYPNKPTAFMDCGNNKWNGCEGKNGVVKIHGYPTYTEQSQLEELLMPTNFVKIKQKTIKAQENAKFSDGTGKDWVYILVFYEDTKSLLKCLALDRTSFKV